MQMNDTVWLIKVLIKYTKIASYARYDAKYFYILDKKRVINDTPLD